MRTKGIVFGILALFAVIALSATGAYAEEPVSSMVAVSSIETLYGSGFGITDDFAVADGCEEIRYDDDSAEDSLAWMIPGPWGPCMAVHFTMPVGYTTLKTAKFPIAVNDSAPNNSFGWKVLEWTGTAPGSVIASGTITPAETGWYDVDVSGITVSDDFVIAMHWEHGYAPFLFIDTNSTTGRSWQYQWLAEGDEWTAASGYNYMIRAVVCLENGGTPDIDVTPVELEARLEPDEITSETLKICNEGDADLTYNSISISYGTATSMLATLDTSIGTAVSADKEIGYDDGEADNAYGWIAGYGTAVHFTSPDHDTLRTARFYININEDASDNSFDWSVLEWTGTEPGSAIRSGTATPVSDGWYGVDLGGITVPDDFVIAMYWRQTSAPYLGYDSDPPIDRHSWHYTIGWSRWDGEDCMIRAVMGSGTTPPPPSDGWLSVDKTSGTVAPGDCDEIAVTIDATGLETGSYSATIVISSDDPDEGTVTVPVTLDVIDNGGSLVEGDVNGDGCVSLKDSTAIKLNLVGRMDLTADQIKCADTNDDGEVSLKDSTLLRKWLVDKSTTLWESPADEGMEKPVECS
ncbi:MAG: dockerin type I domain-containing protein [Euryarchaeota archaeon]|nr:dockerin type I domain-containing protein [Euryarchaeota archaeon]